MDPPRFYCSPLSPGLVTLSEEESRHALQSLRLRPGAEVILFDGEGHSARGALQFDDTRGHMGPSRRTRKRALPASVAIDAVQTHQPPAAKLTLIVAGCKGPRLDWLVEKCTEMDVWRIVLAEFERSVVRVGAGHVDKLRRTALEACKQCGRVWMPRIEAGSPLLDALPEVDRAPLLVAHRHPDAEWLAQRLLQDRGHCRELAVVVGPEGGLSERELSSLESRGARPVLLAEHVLRVETAAAAVAAIWTGLMPALPQGRA